LAQVTMAITTQPGTQKSARKVPGPAFVLPLLAVLLCVVGLSVAFAISWTKFSRAEVFFAECAREMIAYNNMITPLYHAKPFFDKPILTYWLIVLMYKAFGITHLVARIPSILAGVATVAMTAYATRALATSKKEIAGLVAAMCVGSSFMFFSFSYLCMSDMFLVMFDTLSLILIYAGIRAEKKRTLLWLAAAASMGFGFVTKGPIGIVLPGISAIVYLAATKRLHFIKLHHVIFGAIIAAAIATPWFYAAYKANGTWALAYFFIRENFQRYAAATYDTHKPVWFMVVSLVTGFLPWSVFLPGALMTFAAQVRKGLGGGHDKSQPVPELAAANNHPRGWTLTTAGANGTESDTQKKLYLWTWVAVVTAFFSFSRGKCDYYILPVYPAAAALVAMYLTEQTRRSPRIVALVMSAVFLIAGLASPLLLSIVSAQNNFGAWWVMPTTLTVFGALGVAAAASNRVVASVTSLFLAVCCAGAGFAFQMLPAVGQSQSLDVYADAMRLTPPYTRIGVHTALGHWSDELTFQVRRDPVDISDTKGIVDFFAQGPAIALIPEGDFEKALAESPSLRAMPLSVLDRRMVSSHPLTPGYVIKRKGKLYDTTLLLITN
jgi:4-amino-4-deoxy-L-arabinose transferase-like glycosyltransferase